LGDDDTWERRYFKALAALPYVLLGVSAVLSQLQPYPTLGDRLAVFGLAGLALAWLLLMYTLPPPRWRERPAAMLTYFVGLLAIGAALEAHSFFFVTFVLIGFFQAFMILPTVPAFLAVAATSSVMYVSPANSAFRGLDALPGLLFLVGLQTVTVGGGGFIGMRMYHENAKRRHLVAALEAALEENAGLHVQLLTQAREAGMLDERQRLAREIHDTLAQGLAGIITQLEAAEQARLQPDEWRSHVDRARTLARESLTAARRSVQALQPEQLEGARLADAIADMARQWSATTSVALTIETTGRPMSLHAELEITLFRVAQEALTNVAKHAQASRVGLTLSYMEDMVLLDVRDDGSGFSTGSVGTNGRTASGQRFGLHAMEQRLRRVGGKLEIESAPGAGTAINARVPAIPAEGSA
jgi:signal transduction histidine kinase